MTSAPAADQRRLLDVQDLHTRLAQLAHKRRTLPALARLVELDGRLFHDTARQRDADLERDLDAAVEGMGTVRLGWGQVFDRACDTAGKVAALHRARGWTGSARRCGPDCGLGVTH